MREKEDVKSLFQCSWDSYVSFKKNHYISETSQ